MTDSPDIERLIRDTHTNVNAIKSDVSDLSVAQAKIETILTERCPAAAERIVNLEKDMWGDGQNGVKARLANLSLRVKGALWLTGAITLFIVGAIVKGIVAGW